MSRRGRLAFAELEIDERRECPTCHVPINPHLGNLISDMFQCKSCNADLSYRTITDRTVKCPCCNFLRPKPNSLTMLVCGGCEATVIYQRGDEAVKCCICKHITNPTVAEFGYIPRIQGNQDAPPPPSPQANKAVPPSLQANQVVPLSPQVNRVVPPVNRAIRPRVYQRRLRADAQTESTASSSFPPRRESTHTIVAEYPDDADTVAQIVLNIGIRTIKREKEENKTEASSKKIRL